MIPLARFFRLSPVVSGGYSNERASSTDDDHAARQRAGRDQRRRVRVARQRRASQHLLPPPRSAPRRRRPVSAAGRVAVDDGMPACVPSGINRLVALEREAWRNELLHAARRCIRTARERRGAGRHRPRPCRPGRPVRSEPVEKPEVVQNVAAVVVAAGCPAAVHDNAIASPADRTSWTTLHTLRW